jgi:hypothetical protein
MQCIRKQEISDRATAYKRPNLTFPGQAVKTIFVTLDFDRAQPLDFAKDFEPHAAPSASFGGFRAACQR